MSYHLGEFWITEIDGVRWVTDRYLLIRADALSALEPMLAHYNLKPEVGKYECDARPVTLRYVEPKGPDPSSIIRQVQAQVTMPVLTRHTAAGRAVYANFGERWLSVYARPGSDEFVFLEGVILRAEDALKPVSAWETKADPETGKETTTLVGCIMPVRV